MAKRDLIVIGTSSGGVEALRTIVAALPSDFAASLFVVMHSAANSPGLLDKILQRETTLRVEIAQNNQKFKPGHIYVAPPDHHLILEPGIICLSRGPKENRFRPAVDPLFRSAAQTYGPRVVGVILTGGLDDGTAGLWAIKQLGGTTVVQEPAEALAPSMPASALRNVKVDYCVPLVEIGPLLGKLVDTCR
jgi:two-component system chemotaxis response regulator CheB